MLESEFIERAPDHGWRQVFTCTGKAVTGEPQHSFGNFEKSGYRRSHVRENCAP